MFDRLVEARDFLASALEVLDEVRAPSEIGAYVDLALRRLDQFLADSDQKPGSAVPF